MDELEMIRGFEANVQVSHAAREAARAKLRASMRRRYAPRRRTVVAALLAAAICAAAALGADAIGLFPGHAPSPRTAANLALFNHPTTFLRKISETPGLLVSQARGVAAQRTRNGTFLLWGVPVQNGNLCTFVQLVGEKSSRAFSFDEQRPGSIQSGACTGKTTIQPPILWSQRLYGPSARRVVEGHVTAAVSSLVLRHGKNSIVVPLYNGFFLLEIGSDEQPRTLIGHSLDGHTIARASLPAIASPSTSFAAPAFYDSDLLFQANTPDGSGAVFAVRFGPDGTATYALTETGAGGGWHLSLRSRHIVFTGVGDALAGYAGARAHSAAVQYADHTQQPLHLVHGFFLWLKPQTISQKHGAPTHVISFDAQGNKIYSASIN
jgi:hypothetical protein